jgi:hypothetical protein
LEYKHSISLLNLRHQEAVEFPTVPLKVIPMCFRKHDWIINANGQDYEAGGGRREASRFGLVHLG